MVNSSTQRLVRLVYRYLLDVTVEEEEGGHGFTEKIFGNVMAMKV